MLKLLATLIGLLLTLGGIFGFFVGIWLMIAYFTYDPSGPRLAGAEPQTPPDILSAILVLVGGVLALYIGTQLGRYARGDFD